MKPVTFLPVVLTLWYWGELWFVGSQRREWRRALQMVRSWAGDEALVVWTWGMLQGNTGMEREPYSTRCSRCRLAPVSILLISVLHKARTCRLEAPLLGSRCWQCPFTLHARWYVHVSGTWVLQVSPRLSGLPCRSTVSPREGTLWPDLDEYWWTKRAFGPGWGKQTSLMQI